MKSVSINIEDAVYDYMEKFSVESGESILSIIEKSCLIGFSVLISKPIQSSEEIETWKRERNFGRYGRRKTVSHSLCG